MNVARHGCGRSRATFALMLAAPGYLEDQLIGADMCHEELDSRDKQILAERQAAFDKRTGPRVGDYVIFADGVERRISYDFGDEGYQACGGCLFYLGTDYMSSSRSLYATVPADSLVMTDETRGAPAWFFHLDQRDADNGVNVTVQVRVYRCSLPAPRS
jgi:hypothetical protein